jgi:hypothetical protein
LLNFHLKPNLWQLGNEFNVVEVGKELLRSGLVDEFDLLEKVVFTVSLKLVDDPFISLFFF